MNDLTSALGAFSEEEYARRIRKVRDAMAEDHHDLHALLITSPENIYYLIGLTHQGYFAFTMLILPREGELALITRQMETVTISAQAPNIHHLGYADEEVVGAFSRKAIEGLRLEKMRIGVDLSSMFMPAGVWEDLKAGLPGVDWVDSSRSSSTSRDFRAGLVDQVRLVKSSAELAYIRRAGAISDRAAQAGFKVAGVGVNEKEVAAEVYRTMILGGGEYPGFAPLIRSTETLKQEHATWRDRYLEAGDRLFLELSGASARYHAPLGRMGHIGRVAPGGERVYAVATDALNAVVRALRPGTETGDVYERWQEVVDDGLGHTRLRRHHCGYTVGIGFPPSWVGSSTVLGIRRGGIVEIKEGMVFHILSWITDDELGDYLVSDTAIVGPETTEMITTAPRNLLVD